MDRIQYDIISILQEIPESEGGVGSDISLSLSYDQIKEARREEDPRLSMGIWERDLKKANWTLVASLSSEILANISKDLQVVAWLMESIINTEGIPGITTSLQILQSFLESFWYTCYPKDEEEKSHILYWIEDKINNIVFTKNFVKDISLYEYEYATELKSLSKRSIEAETEIAKTSKKENRRTVEDLQRIIENSDIQALIDNFLEIESTISSLLNTTSKIFKDKYSFSFSKVLTNIKKIKTLINTNNTKVSDTTSSANQQATINTGNLNRTQIYTQLQQLSHDLKEIERHSPTPLLLDLVASWKDMSLLEIMKNLQEGTTEAHNLLKILLRQS